MNEEEIRGYLNRIDELEQRLKGKDKKTLQWLIFGYNECAKLLNERKQENKQQKEIIDKAKEYIKNHKRNLINEITHEKYEVLDDENIINLLEILDNKGE